MRITAIIFALALAQTANAGRQLKLAVVPTQIDPSAEGRVPGLLDDYVMTAVADLGTYQVIGQDDINAMIGFEQQKDLLGCDDASCFADIGGALGVDKILVVKVALTGEQWVSTMKLIDIQGTWVEARGSEFIQGDAGALLRGVAGAVQKLFGRQPASAAAGVATSPAAAAAAAPGDESEEPTRFEVRVQGSVGLIGKSSEDLDPATITPGQSKIYNKFTVVDIHVAWQETRVGPFLLLLDGSAGVAGVGTTKRDDDGTGSQSGGNPALHLQLLQLARFALYSNWERWGFLPSDRVSIELGAGPHLVVGPETLVGLSLRGGIHVAYLYFGATAALTSETGLGVLVELGARVGF